jgi:sialidase-1
LEPFLLKSSIVFSIVSAAVSTTLSTAVQAEPLLSTPVDVFVGGVGYPNYRTPSITALPDGSLVAIAEGRSFDDPGVGTSDLDIVSRRSTDGGATWSPLQVVDSWAGGSSSNPTTVLDKTTGRLFLLYNRWAGFDGTVDSQPNTTDNTAWMRYSDNGGQSWSAPTDITAGVKDVADWNTISFGPGSGIQASNGRLIIPSARWVNGWNGYAVYSNDNGVTWTRGTLVPGGNLSGENQLVQLSNGSILMDARNNTGSGVRLDSTSANGGLTWSTMTPSQSGPDSEAAIERYTLTSAGDDQNRIVFTSPSDPDSREDLVVRTSYDEGLSYINQRLLYDGYSGYSDITILPDKSIGVLFETNEARNLTFLKFNREWIEPPQRLNAYEGFSYNSATLGTKNGGLLWNSGWTGSPTTLTGTPTAQIVNSDLTYTNFPFSINGQRSVSFNNGGSMARALPVPIDLKSDKTWYFSMLIQQDTVAGDQTGGSQAALDVLLYSGASRTMSFGVQGDDSFYINMPGYGASTASGALDKDTVYYLVAKLVATSATSSNDQLFLKAYRTGDAVPATDDALGWTLAGTASSNLNSVIDRIAIKGGSLTDWLVDEFRFGSSFGAVVSNSLRYEWNVNAAGNWSADANWFDGAPIDIGQTAVFGSAITTPQTITVDGAKTVGGLSFNNANSYTLAGSTITLSSTGTAPIDVIQGSHTINAPLLLTANTVATIAAASTLTLNGGLSSTANVTLTKAGDGTLKLPNVRTSALTITDGSVDILPHSSASGASRLSTLSITPGATLDLANNDLILDYASASPLATIQALLRSGYANGSWSGNGITSSSAQMISADASNPHKTGLGIADNANLMLASFDGENVGSTSLLVRYTYLGDSNLDGVVNALDFNALANHYGAASAAGWQAGDFNYDGTVNSLDFSLLAANYGMSESISAALPNLVPEPSALMLMAFAAPVWIRRRR